MLYRQIAGYVPAIAVPVTVAFVSIYLFTRLVTPAEYGLYALVASVALMCQAMFFYWLQVGATRFIAAAQQQDSVAELQAGIYWGYLGTAVIYSAGFVLVLICLPLTSDKRNALLLGLVLVLAKGLVAVNQALHRGSLRILRYNLIECGQSLAGLMLGWLLVAKAGMGGTGILLGLVVAALCSAMVDIPAFLQGLRQGFERQQFISLLRFGLPLTACYALNFVLSTSDRLLVDYFLGGTAVGVYSVSYAVMDRTLTSLFLAVSLAAFPLAVRLLEKEGPDAAKAQLYRNGTALLALVIPGCLGLIAVNEQIAAVLIGPEYRAVALTIMPWIAVSTLLAGLQIHFFDHAFHLGKRTELFIWTIGPAAVINIGLNIVLLPRYGLMGAVWATLVGYIVAVACSAWVGRKVFVVPFPLGPTLRCLVAAVLMFFLLRWLQLPATGYGLTMAVLAGAVSYGVLALALDVAGARTWLWQRFFEGVRN